MYIQVDFKIYSTKTVLENQYNTSYRNTDWVSKEIKRQKW